LNLRPLIPMTSALTLSYTPENLETDGNNRPNRRAFVNRNSEGTLKVSANGEQMFKILCATCSGAACLYSLKRSGDRKSGPLDSDFSVFIAAAAERTRH
jgi:hypothetical protein